MFIWIDSKTMINTDNVLIIGAPTKDAIEIVTTSGKTVRFFVEGVDETLGHIETIANFLTSN